MEWRGTTSARQKKFRVQESLVKTLLIVFVMLPEFPTASLFLKASQ
jgi:hypothetical protein